MLAEASGYYFLQIFSAIIKSVFLVDLITLGIMYYNEMVNLVIVIANYRGGEGSHRNDSHLKYVELK